MTINTYLGSKSKTPIKIKKTPNNINYGSDTQIIEIFGRLGEPIMDIKENLVIPRFTKTGKIDKSVKYRTGEEFFTIYKNQLPNSIMIPFIDMLMSHRELSTAIETFGENVIGKINKITGKLHTEYRQAAANTGRMQSGGGKDSDKINSQNIPSRASWAIPMRNCFLAPKGYTIGTDDYTGAELIIMCSLSQDMDLLEISKQDMHSYVAQKCWRAIYNYRARVLINKHEGLRLKYGVNYTDEELVKAINKLIDKSLNYIVNKTTEEGKIRNAFKPITFGTIYGMYATKCAKSLKVLKEEGEIVIRVIKSLFPKVFNMVESKSDFAERNGYLILNTRTNSRAWFPNIIKCIQGKLNPKENFIILNKEKNEARNICIQGTQADAVKEATVELQKYIFKHKLDVVILGWVHDEIIDKHPIYLNGISEEWKEYLNKTGGLTFINDKGELTTGLSFSQVKRLIMIEVFNRYLENVTIDVESKVEPFWTK
jgi:DNA polymerase-1